MSKQVTPILNLYSGTAEVCLKEKKRNKYTFFIFQGQSSECAVTDLWFSRWIIWERCDSIFTPVDENTYICGSRAFVNDSDIKSSPFRMDSSMLGLHVWNLQHNQFKIKETRYAEAELSEMGSLMGHPGKLYGSRLKMGQPICKEHWALPALSRNEPCISTAPLLKDISKGALSFL